MTSFDIDLQTTDPELMLTPDQVASFAEDFKTLPEEQRWVRDMIVKRILTKKMADFYGTSENSTTFRVYHGTVDSRLESIAQTGMKAFVEAEGKEPRIFVTASPTLAMWHTIENRPHDTLRKAGKIDDSEVQGDPVLLVIQIDKALLNQSPEAQKPSVLPEWLKERQGISPEDDKRIRYFEKGLKEEVDGLQEGSECSDFGITFPISEIAPEFIFIQESDGGLRPIQEAISSPST
jgi:hypothetical protein